MAIDQRRLVWLDMEMTGLNPDSDTILELAMVVTDADLNVVAESASWAVHQTDATLAEMDDWNTKTHGVSGLTERVRRSPLDMHAVEQAAIAFMQAWVGKGVSPVCGNSICQDRRFMARYMPELVNWFHYRNLDVSTIKELCKRWRPDLLAKVNKTGAHTALADIHESIDELRFYRTYFIKAE
ncbi:MAG: 3'-to-5' oligoribonuclease (orn) [Fluviibacter phosphoraccumulans EoVTN8]